MISDGKLAANRANARKSTGPRTAEGKARSRRNALKHGNAGSGVVVPEDETREADACALNWVASMRPRDEAERAAVEAMARASVRVERIALASLAALRACTPDDPEALDVVLLGHRYEQAREREFDRAFDHYIALRARLASAIPDEPNAEAGRVPDEPTAPGRRAPIEANGDGGRAPIEANSGEASREAGPGALAPIEPKSAAGDERRTKPISTQSPASIRVAAAPTPEPAGDPGRRAGRLSPKRLASALAAARSAASRNKPNAGGPAGAGGRIRRTG